MDPRRDAGFTLVELLVCCAIISLLVLFAVPKAHSAANKARESQVQADLQLIHDALVRHYLDKGYYPVKLRDLTKYGYLRPNARLKSPASGKWYFYAVDDNRATSRVSAFVLGAPGTNRRNTKALYHGRPLPVGRRPDRRAYAWIQVDGEKDRLRLFADDDSSPWSGPLPTDLSTYRSSCKPASPIPCDLVTN